MSGELKCPYCPEQRPSRSRLVNHISAAHSDAAASVALVAAVNDAAQVVQHDTAADMIALPDTAKADAAGRADLKQRLAETGERLKTAGAELAELKVKADAVLVRLEALDAGVMDPDIVRRATLLQVWDRLTDAGNTEGVQQVQQMINALNAGDWS